MTRENLEFECFCGENFEEWEKHSIRFSCNNLEFYKEYDGKPYCLLHYPHKDKAIDFSKLYEEKIETEDFDFEGTLFPVAIRLADKKISSKVNFSNSTFSSSIHILDSIFKEEVSFTKAIFQGPFQFEVVEFEKPLSFSEAHFIRGETLFDKVKFKSTSNFTGGVFETWAFFKNCFFNEAAFDLVRFLKRVYFSHSKFNKASIRYSTFEDDTFFSNAEFTRVKFVETQFQQYTAFRNTKFLKYADFEKTKFDIVADFNHAVFENIADFTETTFGNHDVESKYDKGGYFDLASFASFALFIGAKFEFGSFRETFFGKEAVFKSAEFSKNASFTDARFQATANFKSSSFKQKAVFQGTIVEGSALFIGSKDNPVFHADDTLDLNEIRVYSPEKISFHTLRLRPIWFLDTDSRKFNFTRINWINADGKKDTVKREISSVTDAVDLHELFIITCRQLAENAEENNNFENASNFRKMALETERLARKEKRRIWLAAFNDLLSSPINITEGNTAIKGFWKLIKTFPIGFLHFFYRILSGYGERWFRAFCWLIAIWLIGAVLYASPLSSFIDKHNYNFGYWFAYSLNVITLQRPDPKPANAFTMILIGLEVLFAPVQAALLILAVRRKFMR
jgi:uncharacterized protein YjbI with pentapeptide repeats